MTGYANMHAYRRTQIEQAGPEEVLLRLMEAGVRSARQTYSFAEQEELVRARESALRTLDVVTELDGSLNREADTDVVADLDALYSFLVREISDANMKSEFHRFRQVESILHTLYEGWKDAVAEYRSAQGKDADTGVAVGAQV